MDIHCNNALQPEFTRTTHSVDVSLNTALKRLPNSWRTILERKVGKLGLPQFKTWKRRTLKPALVSEGQREERLQGVKGERDIM